VKHYCAAQPLIVVVNIMGETFIAYFSFRQCSIFVVPIAASVCYVVVSLVDNTDNTCKNADDNKSMPQEAKDLKNGVTVLMAFTRLEF